MSKPFIIGLTIANAGNILADIVSKEERANYWIDQYNLINPRLIGGVATQEGTGSFERGTNPFDVPKIYGTSNFMSDFNLIKELFSPVEHSIPLDTLINVHFIMILGLFVLVFSLILLYIYFCVNLIIIINKDFFIKKVKNRYALMYVKYVLFKSRVDIAVIAIFIISILCFILYILHYLIIHPIIVNT